MVENILHVILVVRQDKNNNDMFLERLQSTKTPDVKVKEKDK